MRLLIDTHALVWMSLDPDRMSAEALDALTDVANPTFISAASAYEIELKRDRDAALKRMPDDLREAADLLGYQWLPMSVDDVVAAARLPRLHRDPWDRMIVAQARQLELMIVTKDRVIAAYDVPTLW